MVNVKLSNENEKDEYSYLSITLLAFVNQPHVSSLGFFLKVCSLTFSIPEGMMNSCPVAGADPGFFLGRVHH